MPGARDLYSSRVAAHRTAGDRERRASAALSRWRLATFLPALGLLIWGLARGGPVTFAAAAVLLVAFAVLVVKHARVEERVAWFDSLRIVNERAVARLDRHWDGLRSGEPPPGISIEAHPYATDLDLFGRASLFQWLDQTATPHGAATLARWLMSAAEPAVVTERQGSVDELARADEWREQLAAYGVATTEEYPAAVQRFLEWVESTTPPLPKLAALRIVVYGVLGSLWLLIALHAAGLAPALWSIPLLAAFILSFAAAKRLLEAFDAAGASELALRRYAPLLAHLTEPKFETSCLSTLQRRLRSEKETAPAAMSRLNRILDFSKLSRGAAILHLPIQLLTLWDFHVLLALVRWREAAASHVRDWLAAAGEIDALACLAAIRHDYPEWCRPTLTTERVVRARALGHPLLRDDRRVTNDVSVGPPRTVLLVTGSNMSGKSTLLRAIGLNTVLAQAGAPACAAELALPPADLQTSIRIQDSLERGISYFMAALARLKGVVDAAERESSDRVLMYLLDEILQGTNSAERGIAVQAVARHLLDAGAIGAMTTHDLTIAEAEPLKSAAVLVHFMETVDEQGRMEFDYKLRSGIATSRNALRLMRLIGISE